MYCSPTGAKWPRSWPRAHSLPSSVSTTTPNPRLPDLNLRSEERRVGKECRSRGSPDDEKKKRARAVQQRVALVPPPRDLVAGRRRGVLSPPDARLRRALRARLPSRPPTSLLLSSDLSPAIT